ncbi:fungal-specific transcription factor domain-containing protein [Aspergillus parasiticus]|uniref:Fungal-specific transcription factor domain-containing protein n=1 Tax=Aspergillus parasiticus TaxID=5067 RepID=A0A5N6E5L8_ASPPA|nr:fungal-specific transcription factor domain-containing protein [Aspergillus parasiticus]
MTPTKQSHKRKNVTTACLACRDSKIKFSNNTFPIGHTTNMRECDLSRLSLRLAVDLLVNRVGQLCQFINDQGLQPPKMPDEDDSTLRHLLQTRGMEDVQSVLKRSENNSKNVPDAKANRSQPPDSEGEHPFIEDLNPDLIDPNLFLMSFPDVTKDIPQRPAHSDTVASLPAASDDSLFQDCSDDTFDDNLSDSEGVEELVTQLSDRMGSLQIGSDGHVRYYGPTSHFNLLRMPTPDNLTIHRTVRQDGPDVLDRLGVNKEIPAGFEEHLINLYFTWHNPLFQVVDREMYEPARQQWRTKMEETPYYSEALTNAMCCLGAAFEPRYHPDFITYPRSVSDFFADRAKALLEIELDSPTLATVQAMVVLSAHDVGCKRNSRGWLYSGMAMRLAFDLGLHIDTAHYVTEGSINAAEAELRRTVFWGTYTVDHLWGFFLGRPVRINMEDVTVDKPGRHQTRENDRKWVPYGLPSPPPACLAAPVPDPVDLLSQHRIQLCEIMTPLGHVLYGCSRVSKRILQGLNENTTDRLLKWKANLPEALQIDLDNADAPVLPHILLLHMQYHQTIIHAHRPWISKRYIQPQPPQGPGHIHARKMCIESAIAISQLLHLYETQYTFRRMNVQAVSITCSAALMLIFATIASLKREGNQEISAYLSICFRALEEFGVSWESAKRAQNFLISLQRRWESRVRSYNSAKRAVSQSQSRSHESGVLVGEEDVRAFDPAGSGFPIDPDMMVELDWLCTEAMPDMSP